MLEPVSVALKFGFLIVLYLFLMWVAWSACVTCAGGGGRPGPPHRPPVDATGMYDAAAGLADPELEGARSAPARRAGPRPRVRAAPTTSPTGPRSGGARWRSSSRIPSPPRATPASRGKGHVFVIEDLGSTNGTYLNDEPLGGPQPLHPGDRIRIGDSEFSYVQ